MLEEIKEMNITLKHKKKNTLDIFSNIKRINRDDSYETLQNDIKNLDHNVGLLQLYATSNGKINLKKINLFKTKPLKHRNTTFGKGLYNGYNFKKKGRRYSSIFCPENPNKNLNNSEKIEIPNKNLFDLPKIPKTEKKLLKTDNNTKNNLNTTKFETKNNYSTNTDTIENLFNHTNCNSTSLDFLDNKNIISNSILLTSTNIKSQPKNRYNNYDYKKNKKFPTLNLKKRNYGKLYYYGTPIKHNINESRDIIKEELPQIVSQMRTDNYSINKLLYSGKKQLNLVDWYMKARFKYSEYRFGVAEIQKYFMDIESFGKPEQDEIEKRKTFYDFAEQAVNEINEDKFNKEIADTKTEYGINLKPKPLSEDEKKKILKKILDNKKLYLNKRSITYNKEQDKLKYLSKILEEVSERQKSEKTQRDRIKKLVLMCKNKAGLINNYRGSLLNCK